MEDHLHMAAQGLELILGCARDIDFCAVVAETDLAVGGVIGAQQGAAYGGLARATFADEPETLALKEREADLVDGADLADDLVEEAADDGEIFLQVVHFE